MSSSVTIERHSDISVVDFHAFLDGTNKQAVGSEIFASLRDTGFVYLVNHGLSREKVDAMFKWVRISSNRTKTKRLILRRRPVQTLLLTAYRNKDACAASAIWGPS